MFRIKIQSKWRVLSSEVVKIDKQVGGEANKDKEVARINEKKQRLAVASAQQMPNKKARKSNKESSYAVI